jgi:polyisoprenoid-binding protein YceI
MKRIRTAALAALAVLAIPALASQAMAETKTYTIDPAHSHMGFTVRHMFSNLEGSFDTFSGAVTLDPKTGQITAAKGVIETASVDTHHEKRDGHLKSPDFFDVAKYPTMTFTAKSFKQTPEGTDVTGDFTLRGVTKEVTFKTKFLGAGKDPFGGERMGLSAHTRINRKDYGVDFNKVLDSGGLLIGDEVDINLEIEGMTQ